MARPKTKQELISQATQNYDELLKLVETLDENLLEKPGACDKWSVKDMLAHLHEWHNMLLSWFKAGANGETPAIPSEKYTWRQTPELNEEIYQKYKSYEYKKVRLALKDSHEEVLEIINNHTDKELFTKKLLKWTGSTSFGAYLVSATSSHYDWAIKLIKKFAKANS